MRATTLTLAIAVTVVFAPTSAFAEVPSQRSLGRIDAQMWKVVTVAKGDADGTVISVDPRAVTEVRDGYFEIRERIDWGAPNDAGADHKIERMTYDCVNLKYLPVSYEEFAGDRLISSGKYRFSNWGQFQDDSTTLGVISAADERRMCTTLALIARGADFNRWKPFSNTTEGGLSFDERSVTRRSGTVSVWVRSDLFRPNELLGHRRFNIVVEQYDVSCSRRILRIHGARNFYNGTTVVQQFIAPTPWSSPEPESVGENLLGAVCR